MEHLHKNKDVAAAGLALVDAIAKAYPGLIPALEDMGVEVVTERGAIAVRVVKPEGGALTAAPLPAGLGLPKTTTAGGGMDAKTRAAAAATPPETGSP